MAFTPKDWRDTPDTTTPLSAAAIENLEVRVTNYTDAVAIASGFGVDAGNFGAVGDGVADDTAAIQAAVDSLFNASKQGTVVLLKKTYKISGRITVKDGVNIMGTGGNVIGGNPTIKCTTAGAGLTIEGAGAICQNFSIDGNAVSDSPLLITGGRTFIHVISRNAVLDACLVYYCQNATFIDCTFWGCGRDALVLDYGCGGLTFHNLETFDYGAHGIRFGLNSGQANGVYQFPIEIAFYGGRTEYGRSGVTNVIEITKGARITFDRFGIVGPQVDPATDYPLVNVRTTTPDYCQDILFASCDFHTTPHAYGIQVDPGSWIRVLGGFTDTAKGFLYLSQSGVDASIGRAYIIEPPKGYSAAPIQHFYSPAMIKFTVAGGLETEWTAPTFTLPWVNANVGYRLYNGRVVFRGSASYGVTAAPSGDVPFTLPVGFRPALNSYFPIVGVTNSSVGFVRVDTDGTVHVYTTGISIDLSTVSFIPEG